MCPVEEDLPTMQQGVYKKRSTKIRKIKKRTLSELQKFSKNFLHAMIESSTVLYSWRG
jgi:hypothetical protein